MSFTEEVPENTIFIVAGATLRAEEMDRPLAYKLKQAIEGQLGENAAWHVTVLSDIWYLNNEHFHSLPTISVGGPGVNALSANLFDLVPVVLEIDHVLRIQMDLTHEDRRCAIWGMDHESTVEAVDTFVQRGHLNRFLEGLGTF